MRIDSGLPIQNSGEVERTHKKPVQRQMQESDAVTSELSGEVVRLSSLEEKANSGSEIREQRVAQLKEAVNSGTYEVSDSALANAILKDVLRK